MAHVPVLLQETIEGLNLSTGKTVFEGTLGAGGHARKIIEQIMPGGMYIGCDRDGTFLDITSRVLVEEFPSYVDHMRFVHGNYRDVSKMLRVYNTYVDAALLDIGFSSWHIESSKRGFGLRSDEILDMRYDVSQGDGVAVILNSTSESDLANIFYQYGEERLSRQIAKAIVARRRTQKIYTAKDLAQIIWDAVPGWYRNGKIHPATRTFQALRIYVNDELGALETFLSEVLNCVKKGGRVAIISFHSLEDRMVKNAFRLYNKEKRAKEITKKPITPSLKEIQSNPKSRSAKLRIIEKT